CCRPYSISLGYGFGSLTGGAVAATNQISGFLRGLGRFLFGQPAFRVDGSRAAGTGRGDRLPVGAVNQVPRCEHTRNAGAGGGVLDLHVALVVDVELVADQLAPRVVADGDEQPGDVQLGFLT